MEKEQLTPELIGAIEKVAQMYKDFWGVAKDIFEEIKEFLNKIAVAVAERFPSLGSFLKTVEKEQPQKQKHEYIAHTTGKRFKSQVSSNKPKFTYARSRL